MQKTAEEIATVVLLKLAFRVPGLAALNAVGRANKNPGNLALRAAKVTALREAPETVRSLERMFRRPPRDLSTFYATTGSAFGGGKFAEVDALPPAPETPTEPESSTQTLAPPLRHQLRDDLAKQQNVFGEKALMQSAPSPELQRALARIQPSTGARALYGIGGALGGAALMGGSGALIARLRQGNWAGALKGGLVGGGAGALSGALAGQHYLQRRRIGDAIQEAYGD